MSGMCSLSTKFVINTLLVISALSFNLYKLDLVKTIQVKREPCYQEVLRSTISYEKYPHWANMTLPVLKSKLQHCKRFDLLGTLQIQKAVCDDNYTYPEFPWQSHPQTAKMDLDSLWWHIFTAIILYMLSYFHTLDPPLPILEILFYWTHIIFTAIVFPHLNHLGDFSTEVSRLILVPLIFALQLTLFFGVRDCHFWTLSIAPLAEIAFWIWTMLV